MRDYFRNASPELYLAGSVVVSIVIAAIVVRIPALAFGRFFPVAGVLVASDMVLYILMRLGLLKPPRDRIG
jgi:hypothetical protein